ncbi:hypothetical protein [Marinimicrobium sp. LS-A18]|uniref:hypothetical protein n=1 Tax=Marinimicrobium sp. LS-A18 TaxID=1381596 RepID=UPI0012695806|nr:hypothetical protein [Marinimicrobium sp. LS-A18]
MILVSGRTAAVSVAILCLLGCESLTQAQLDALVAGMLAGASQQQTGARAYYQGTTDDSGIGQCASTGSSYDYQSGNSYHCNWMADGILKLNGYNYSNGTNWVTYFSENGDMKGYDSNQNYWTYTESSGYYINYGTGKSCYGKAALRHCY